MAGTHIFSVKFSAWMCAWPGLDLPADIPDAGVVLCIVTQVPDNAVQELLFFP